MLLLFIYDVTTYLEQRCLSHLPDAVGNHPAHFDLTMARAHAANSVASGDWLVLQLQELISLAYQVLNMYILFSL